MKKINHIASKKSFIKSKNIVILPINTEVLLTMFVIRRYKTPKEIPIVFPNGSKFDYHFIIKELSEEFKGQFEQLGENTENYITFSVPIKKELEKNIHN